MIPLGVRVIEKKKKKPDAGDRIPDVRIPDAVRYLMLSVWGVRHLAQSALLHALSLNTRLESDREEEDKRT